MAKSGLDLPEVEAQEREKILRDRPETETDNEHSQARPDLAPVSPQFEAMAPAVVKKTAALSAGNPPGTDRIRRIDVTRGLLIFWMTIAHALTVRGIGADHWLYYLRPPGWATVGFAFLSGYNISEA